MYDTGEAEEKFIHEHTENFKIEVEEDIQKRKAKKGKPAEYETRIWWMFTYKGKNYGHERILRMEESEDGAVDKIERQGLAFSERLNHAYRTLIALKNEQTGGSC